MSERWISGLTDQGARFADGRVVDFGDPIAELAAGASQTVICDLSHDGLILVSGEDAATYLQAQLCNDVLALDEGKVQWNGWCSPKGRLLATFLAWKGRQGFLLQLPRPLQAAIQKRMQMFVLRSKVTLVDESANWVRIGVAGPQASSLVHAVAGQVPEFAMSSVHIEGGRIVRISANRFELVTGVDNAMNWWHALSRQATVVGAQVWDGLQIREGILTVVPATQDLYVPQMANFELIGGVSFKKGCYPGQEIVARTQYRGILKRRMALIHGHSTTVPNPGDPVYSREFADQVAGSIANAAATPGGGFDALVVAQIEALKGGTLALESADGPRLVVMPLPYAVPELA